MLKGLPERANFTAISVAETARPKSTSTHQSSRAAPTAGVQNVSSSPSSMRPAIPGFVPAPLMPPKRSSSSPKSPSTANWSALRAALIVLRMKTGLTRPAGEIAMVPSGALHSRHCDERLKRISPAGALQGLRRKRLAQTTSIFAVRYKTVEVAFLLARAVPMSTFPSSQ